MELYVLRIDNYKEWAWENGACNLLGVYDTQEQVYKELLKHLEMEQNDNGYYIGDDNNLLNIEDQLNDWCKMNIGNNYYVDVCVNEDEYHSGFNSGTYVIEKKILNESEVLK